ncbi:hypothetical protein [Frankia sp. R43]|uniref:hypothetical protein n=1 Tax=Frankia sp. R43 TaxID=269536 RepID=UPI001379D1FC|nr:hypothetical protein [Frankia sp. R43]
MTKRPKTEHPKITLKPSAFPKSRGEKKTTRKTAFREGVSLWREGAGLWKDPK